eukprot:Opistho-1_new@32349
MALETVQSWFSGLFDSNRGIATGEDGSKVILVTGGAGFIGSHTVVELLSSNYQVVIVDNLYNASQESVRRVEQISGKRVAFYNVDIRDKANLARVFAAHKVHAVIHFAGLKAVGESSKIPIDYYQNNITGTLVLLEVMKEANVKRIVFSSSATVYGVPQRLPLDEEHPLSATNPYGRTKLFIEEILKDVAASDKEWSIVLLRYFNPIGAHKSGLIGEDPKGLPNNLMPYVAQVAVGRLPELSVFGNDYDTKDGTGVRDYIHVVDLAQGHVAALAKIESSPSACLVYNLGTGTGYSVLEMVAAMEKASGRKVPYKIVPRRPGDVASVYANPAKATAELGWTAKRGLEEMCEDLWRWQQGNPNGFAK